MLAVPEVGGGWRTHQQHLHGFRPGDHLRRLQDGQFAFAGRANDVFLLRGVLVSPVELEAFLEAQPGVREAVVFGAESSVYGAVPMAVVQFVDGLDPIPTANSASQAFEKPKCFGRVAPLAVKEVGRPVGHL
ncbi:hypothetical protein KBY96_06325 [Cyanobium sp. ATX 6A2]|nr:hypothetical protein [Cyanobium sp. ATX 6A2]